LKIEYDGMNADMGTDDYKIPDRELELLARMLLPEIKKFFADEEVKQEFELWQARQEKDIEQGRA
jgi:lipase chaperone LimK